MNRPAEGIDADRVLRVVQGVAREARPHLDHHVTLDSALEKELGLDKGSGAPNRNKIGKLSTAQVRKIAELKMPDLNCESVEAAMAMVAGAARSMGVEVGD